MDDVTMVGGSADSSVRIERRGSPSLILVAPPQLFSSSQTAASVIPPLGLMYLGAACREAGIDVSLLDTIVEAPNALTELTDGSTVRGLTTDQVIERVRGRDVVGVSCHFTMAFPVVVDLVRRLRERTDATVVLGGAHVTALPQLSLRESGAHFVVIGEGDVTLVDLVGSLAGGAAISDVAGLAYWKNGEPVLTERRPLVEDLDSLPLPARDMVPLADYQTIAEPHGAALGPWTSILSSRGCPFECTFCTSALWGRRWRARSATAVVDEMEHCVRTHGITDFHFEDEAMTTDRRRVIDICDELCRRGLSVTWQLPNGVRAATTDGPVLEAMQRSGCRQLTVAPESGSTRVLNHIVRKRQDLGDVARTVREASRLGIATAAFFVIGLPGERLRDVAATLWYALHLARMGLDEVDFSLFVPLPGSELYDRLADQGRIAGDDGSLVCMGDLTVARSWSDDLSGPLLFLVRLLGFLTFHVIRSLFHPLRVLASLGNMVRGRQTTKSERVVATFRKRLFR